MEMQLFAIRDNKSGHFDVPHAMPHVSEAIRAFESVVADPQSKLHQYSRDYDLYQVGHYDTITGIVTPDNLFITTIQSIFTNMLQRVEALKLQLQSQKQEGGQATQCSNSVQQQKTETIASGDLAENIIADAADQFSETL